MKELAWGLDDKYKGLKRNTINKLATSKNAGEADIISKIEALAKMEKDKLTKATAIRFLAKKKDVKYLDLFKSNLYDSSYSVAGAAFQGYADLKPEEAYKESLKLRQDVKGDLLSSVSALITKFGNESDFDYIIQRFDEAPLTQEKLGNVSKFGAYLETIKDATKVKQGVDAIVKFRNAIPEQYRSFVDSQIKSALTKLGKAKGSELNAYIDGIISKW